RTLDIAGRDLNLKAHGTLALNETGQSNLRIHADSSRLETIGALIDQPLRGIAKIDATVNGNRPDLRVDGNLTADAVKYGDNGALAASSDFTARIPNLDAESAVVSATTHATFVTLAGQNINDLTARTDYVKKALTFDATAKQPQRSLTTSG